MKLIINLFVLLNKCGFTNTVLVWRSVFTKKETKRKLSLILYRLALVIVILSLAFSVAKIIYDHINLRGLNERAGILLIVMISALLQLKTYKIDYEDDVFRSNIQLNQLIVCQHFSIKRLITS
jgi:small neutral amino acid transporter SnatA (MarC family)